MKDDIYALLEQVEDATNEEETVSIFNAYLPGLGIDYFMIAELAGTVQDDQLQVGTYNPEWVERFFDKEYDLDDPIVISLASGGHDVPWAQLKRQLTRGTKGWKILHEAAEFGLGDGWAFPIFGHNGYLSGVSFAGSKVDDDPATRSALRLLGVYTHSKLLSFRNKNERPPVRLTKRERDVLAWVAEGKNDAQIGEVLSVSESTVHMHVENAKRKLGAQKRVQAVVEAIRHRLIRV
eukprot:gnl/TRDRNA2_/TRDRNA2_31682_c0_seq1.p1 gnl/TRDRNA2_/TRDRNA2_31682_c0~~gnl/TRDRNA2_/TRDRNA2_31682_c0_seq1.p1  ORF type:complete len:236 (+),score=29.69 gnl/TRDRNA2_/TRDRNA2_31682_c0_seq1:229-936(+)